MVDLKLSIPDPMAEHLRSCANREFAHKVSNLIDRFVIGPADMDHATMSHEARTAFADQVLADIETVVRAGNRR